MFRFILMDKVRVRATVKVRTTHTIFVYLTVDAIINPNSNPISYPNPILNSNPIANTIIILRSSP